MRRTSSPTTSRTRCSTIIGEGEPIPPSCDAGGPYNGSVGIPVAFDGTGSTDDGTIVSYTWDFGDGSTDTGPTPTHTYTQAGKFPITLTVVDDENLDSTCKGTATITDVKGQPPVCDANGPYDGLVNESIQFDGTGSTDDGTIVSYAWDFGDGSSDTGPNPTHTYTQEGKFPVSLTVTDDTNLSSTCNATATITAEGGAPICDANGPYDGVVNESIRSTGPARAMTARSSPTPGTSATGRRTPGRTRRTPTRSRASSPSPSR